MLSDQIPLLENKLGIKEGFFNKLSEEDDWAFIIKLHALIESAVSELLTSVFENEELKHTFSHLELSNKRTGKIAFIKALDLLDENDRRYIVSLSEVRNDLVHNISNVNYDLLDTVNKMNKSEFKTFYKRFNTLSTEPDENVEKLFRQDPVQAIWFGGMSVLGSIYLKIEGHL